MICGDFLRIAELKYMYLYAGMRFMGVLMTYRTLLYMRSICQLPEIGILRQIKLHKILLHD